VCGVVCRRCEHEKVFKRRCSPLLTPCGGKSRIFGEVVWVYIEERLLDGGKFNDSLHLLSIWNLHHDQDSCISRFGLCALHFAFFLADS